MWTEDDFHNEASGSSFRLQLRYFLPTSEMLRGHQYRNLLRCGRFLFGWISVQIPGGLSRSRWRGTKTCPITKSFLQLWFELTKQLLGDKLALHPKEVHQSLLPSLFSERALRIKVSNPECFVYYVIFKQEDGGGVYGRREIHIDASYAFHDVLYADPPAPSKINLSEELLAAAFKFYKRLDLKEMRLNAGFNIGGLLWPKFGFRPESADEWAKVKPQIEKNMSLIDDLKISPFRRTIETYLSGKNPNTIWNVSDLKHPIQEGADVRALGDILVRGTQWPGILSFDDDVAMARFSNRVGRYLLADAGA